MRRIEFFAVHFCCSGVASIELIVQEIATTHPMSGGRKESSAECHFSAGRRKRCVCRHLADNGTVPTKALPPFTMEIGFGPPLTRIAKEIDMIEVQRTGEHGSFIFEVVVREGKGETCHHVTMSRE